MYRKYAPLVVITLVALYIAGCGRLLDPFDPPGKGKGKGHGRDTCIRDTVIIPPDTTDPWPPDTTDPWPPDTLDPWPPDTIDPRPNDTAWGDPNDTLDWRDPHDTIPGRRR